MDTYSSIQHNYSISGGKDPYVSVRSVSAGILQMYLLFRYTGKDRERGETGAVPLHLSADHYKM